MTSATILVGTANKGIGYEDGLPVIFDGGDIVPGPQPGDRWAWADKEGCYWAVEARVDGSNGWTRMKNVTPAGGWKLY